MEVSPHSNECSKMLANEALSPTSCYCCSPVACQQRRNPKPPPFDSNGCCCKAPPPLSSPFLKDGAFPACCTRIDSGASQKEITLHHWYLVLCVASDTHEVAVGGFLTEDLLDKDKRETAPIAERIKNDRLITKDGFDVRLAGFIDTDTTCLNGFPFQIAHYFLTGFPCIWNHLLNDWTNNPKKSNCVGPAYYNLHPDPQDAEQEISAQQLSAGDLKQQANDISEKPPPSSKNGPNVNAECGDNLLAADEVSVDKGETTIHEQNVNTGSGLMGVLEDQLQKVCPLSCSNSQSPSERNNICPMRKEKKTASCLATEQDDGDQQDAQKDLAAIPKSTCRKRNNTRRKIRMPLVKRKARSNLRLSTYQSAIRERGIEENKSFKAMLTDPRDGKAISWDQPCRHTFNVKGETISSKKRKRASSLTIEQVAQKQPDTRKAHLAAKSNGRDDKSHDEMRRKYRPSEFQTRPKKARKGRRQATYTYMISVQKKRKRSSLFTEKAGISKLSMGNGCHEKESGTLLFTESEGLGDVSAKENQVAVTSGSSNKLHKLVLDEGANVCMVETASCLAMVQEVENQQNAQNELAAISNSGYKKGSSKKRTINMPTVSILPPPLPTPRAKVSNRPVSEAFGLKTSRSGRLLVPPLAFWQSQSLVHDMDGGIIAIINGSAESAKTATCRFNLRPPNKIQPMNLQKRL